MLRYQLIVAGVGFASFAGAQGQVADPTSNLDPVEPSKEYRAPEGFGGYSWNTPLGKVSRLAPEPVYVHIAHSGGKATHFDSSCFRNIAAPNDVIVGDNLSIALQLCRETDGAGYHALAEYYVDSQGFRIRSDDGGMAVLFPVTYQFCAHWNGFFNELAGDPLERMQLCGVRLHFKSKTAAEELANRELTHITTYERILNWLVVTYGEPEGYKMEGEVFIPGLLPEAEREKALTKDRYASWYWCRPKGEALVPRCTASMALVFDRSTGLGQVLFVTAPVWAYAYARQFGGAEGDPLYRVLNGGMTQPTVQHQCMDSFLCRPSRPKAMPEETLSRFRLPTKAMDVKN